MNSDPGDPSEQYVVWDEPQAMPFSLISSGDFSDYLIEGGLDIEHRVEYDDPMSEIASSGEINLVKPTEGILLDILDLDGLDDRTVLVVKITIDDEPEFMGIVNAEESSYNQIEGVYTLSFYDLFTYVYKNISTFLDSVPVTWNAGGTTWKYLNDNFPHYIETFSSDFVDLGIVLQTYSSVRGDYIVDIDLPLEAQNHTKILLLINAISLNDLIDVFRNYYGAYIYVDGEGNTRMVARGRGIGEPVDITDDIIEDEYVKRYTRPPDYDSVLAFSRIEDGELTFIYVLLYYRNGEFGMYEYTNENNLWLNGEPADASLDQFKYLDLRFSLPGGTSGYTILPERTFEQIKQIYGNIITPHSIVECSVNRMDLSLMQRVRLDDADYVIMSMKKDYLEEYTSLELLKVIE